MNNLDSYTDDQPRQHKLWCECGNRKSSTGAYACVRCSFLDGVKESAAQIIATLRGTDGLSLKELAGEVYGSSTRGACNATWTVVKRLFSAGRVRRYWRDCDAKEMDRTGATGSIARLTVTGGGSGCWVYALDARYACNR